MRHAGPFGFVVASFTIIMIFFFSILLSLCILISDVGCLESFESHTLYFYHFYGLLTVGPLPNEVLMDSAAMYSAVVLFALCRTQALIMRPSHALCFFFNSRCLHYSI
jgi:hypothetical protein